MQEKIIIQKNRLKMLRMKFSERIQGKGFYVLCMAAGFKRKAITSSSLEILIASAAPEKADCALRIACEEAHIPLSV